MLRLLVCLTPALAAHAQQNLPDASQSGPPPRGMAPPSDTTSPTADPHMLEQMANLRDSQRQKQLVVDTEKLFLLAQQLRNEVAKSKKDELSINVVKTSDEIEKLAKRVKDEMRGY